MGEQKLTIRSFNFKHPAPCYWICRGCGAEIYAVGEPRFCPKCKENQHGNLELAELEELERMIKFLEEK